jgi:hypothetical protein
LLLLLDQSFRLFARLSFEKTFPKFSTQGLKRFLVDRLRKACVPFYYVSHKGLIRVGVVDRYVLPSKQPDRRPSRGVTDG